ncbi:dienelactone hydrolase family protein [Ideonella sp. DXS22W]|uniref:Dienelactone hydrolase family protein n=1 Tax=Pseudaquabacterium inlustre TaxID=2984192 RepID=A0ABU9CCT9_9BURK
MQTRDPAADPALAAMAARGYTARPFEAAGLRHTVFSRGQGRPVLLMHELPGMDGPNVAFADRLVAAGFAVHLPWLFGPALRSATLGNYRKLCVSQEFGRLQAGVTAPVVDWLRALAADLVAARPGQRVGAIGMCLTGSFVIPLILEPGVVAAVASQPAMPVDGRYLALGWERDAAWRTQLNVADADLAAAADVARRDGKHLLLQHFSADRACPRERLQRVAEAFGAQAEVHAYQRPGERWRLLRFSPHALLTHEYERHGDGDVTRQALARVIAFLDRHL